GRGKSGGIKFARDPEEAEKITREMLATRIRDRKVEKVLVEKKLEIAEEMYLGITIDEINKRMILLAGRTGGVEVEAIAQKPGAGFARVLVDPFIGVPGFQAKELAKHLGASDKGLGALSNIVSRLYALLQKFDASVAEINPLVRIKDGSYLAADCRVEIDDDAIFRQKELELLGIFPREERGREPTELERKGAEIDRVDHRGVAGRVVEFEGDTALIIGGGGASLTVFDAILKYGGKPANYCEIGGNPTVKKLQLLTELILSKPGVKRLAVVTNVLSNTRVDLVARGVIKGMLNRGIDPRNFPVVFRVPGAWEDEGFRILDKYGIKYFDRTHTMDEAAQYIVQMGKS
ncbi:MAG: succinate--CoA ligase, partial [Proteobacteria bacterium]|nr:succinate--CoA ligase [Pseudomonadota bacterium]